MSLQTEAEQVRDLANKIVLAEIKKAEIIANGGVIFLDEGHDLAVTLTPAQRQAALAVIEGWKQTIKNISAAWT